MSSKPNHRRGHCRIQDNGPRYESSRPCGGCNSTHVAKSRRKWKKLVCRAERRCGKNWKKYHCKARYKILPKED